MKIILAANTDWYLYNFRSSLIDQLIHDGHDVQLSSPNGPYVDKFRQKGIPWHAWNVGRQTISPMSEIPSIKSLFRLYKQEKPDIVHHHTLKGIIYGSIAARFAGVPHVVNSVAGRGLVFSQQSLKSFILRFVINILILISNRRSSTHWIFENNQDQASLTRFGIVSKGQSSLIESVGVDLDRFVFTPEPEGAIKVLYVGRMLWLKGVGDFVEAAKAIKANHDVEFVLVGEPDPGNPDSVPLETIKTWEKEGIITYPGWQPDVEEVYQQAHLVVFPTRYGEGVPTVLLEAAATGRPVIASDHPGCKAVIQNEVNGIIVDPHNKEELQSAIQRLISDPVLRENMGKMARKMIIEPFSKQSINAETISIYHKLLEK